MKIIKWFGKAVMTLFASFALAIAAINLIDTFLKWSYEKRTGKHVSRRTYRSYQYIGLR